jgi:hypothetical protein
MGAAAHVRRAATRMTVTIGAAVLVMATVVPVASASSSDLPPDKEKTTALIMGASGIPTPDDFYVESVRNQFIAPTHPTRPGQTIDYVKATTPEEFWPITGIFRLLALALGSPEIWGPGGPAWPDEPWWKLSGLFDLTFDQSIQAGVADLEKSMAAHGNDHLVIDGYSQAAVVANVEKRKLAEQYPKGTQAPDIDFVLHGDPNLPNGGIAARFPGLYIPILDVSLNGPEPTNTGFDTIVITRQYDLAADFPLYPLNLVADLNALLGFFYVHLHPFDVSLASDTSTSPPMKTQYGDTTYYFFPTQDLPLFGPLRSLGVPQPVIDVVEPFFRVLVELGYDRSIPPGEPTPARLIPRLKPRKVAADLANAIGEGIHNAAALFGLPAPPSSPAAPHAVSAKAVAANDRTVEQNPADDVDENHQATSTGVRQTTLNGTRHTTSTRTLNGTRHTTSTGTSNGTRHTTREDVDPPSTHTVTDGAPVQHAAPSTDRPRVHRGAANAADRAAGSQGTDTA